MIARHAMQPVIQPWPDLEFYRMRSPFCNNLGFHYGQRHMCTGVTLTIAGSTIMFRCRRSQLYAITNRAVLVVPLGQRRTISVHILTWGRIIFVSISDLLIDSRLLLLLLACCSHRDIQCTRRMRRRSMSAVCTSHYKQTLSVSASAAAQTGRVIWMNHNHIAYASIYDLW